MPRRCATCGEPGRNVAVFCGRCGARADAPPERDSTAAPRRRRRTRRDRPVPFRRGDLVGAALALGVVALLATGLEVDEAVGEVDVPDARPAAAPRARPSPAPAPELAWCRDGAPTPLCLVWRRARPQGLPVLADGTRVVVAERDGTLTALDRATGAALWHSSPPLGEARTGVLAGDTVLLSTRAGGSGAGAVTALHAVSGRTRWAVPTTSETEVHAADGSALLVGADHVLGIDIRTGEQRWRWSTSAPAGAALLEGSAAAPVIASGSDLVALDPVSGAVRWSASVPRLRGAALAGVGWLVAVAGDGRMVGLDAKTGTVAWDVRLAFDDRSAVRVHGAPGLALVSIQSPGTQGGARTSRIVAIDPATGEVRWVHLYLSRTDRHGVRLTPTAAVLVGTTSPGTVAVLDLDTGIVRWQRDLGADPVHAREAGQRILAASGRDVVLLTTDAGREVAARRIEAPVLGFEWTDEHSAVLRTTTGVTAVELITSG